MIFKAILLLTFSFVAQATDKKCVHLYLSEHNQHFYNRFNDYSEHSNQLPKVFLNGIDLVQVKDLISKANVILEIGPGDGRVINGVLKQRPHVKIDALETNFKYVVSLKNRFATRSNVSIKHGEIHKMNGELGKYDLALWMFSGLSDLGIREVEYAFKRVSNVLVAGGNFVIDLAVIKEDEANQEKFGIFDTLSSETDYTDNSDYIVFQPSENYLLNLASKNNLSLISNKTYLITFPSNGEMRTVTRRQYIFQKINS